jgi:hypothetical protein
MRSSRLVTHKIQIGNKQRCTRHVLCSEPGSWFFHGTASTIVAIGLIMFGLTSSAQAAFTLTQTINDPLLEASKGIGNSVSISGNNVLVGTRQTGARLFDATTGALLQTFNDPTTPDPTDVFAGTGAASISGDNVLIGERGEDASGSTVGQAHLFSASTGVLLQTFNDPTVTTADQFGN